MKTITDTIDDEDKIRKKEKKLKEVLRIAIHHIVDHLVVGNLNRTVQEL